MRTPSAKTKSKPSLKPLITATAKLWRKYHLTYDQARYVTKEGEHKEVGGYAASR